MTEKIKPTYTRPRKEVQERLENTMAGVEHYAGQEYLGIVQDKPEITIKAREKRIILQAHLDVLTWYLTEDNKQ